MSTFSIGLNWQRTTPDFDVKTFSRDHVWRLAGGQTVQGSSAPDFSGNPEMSNPEEALLAALSSCHMLTFLAIVFWAYGLKSNKKRFEEAANLPFADVEADRLELGLSSGNEQRKTS